MAIGTVNQMVKDRAPFLNNTTFDALIERKRIEVAYIMQKQSGKLDADVELESNYTALQNILFAAMIVWYQVKSKVLQNMGGDGVTGAVGGAKVLKKVKADVTEAEWMIADKAILSMDTDEYLKELQKEICDVSKVLGWINPICVVFIDIIPAFIIGADFPPAICTEFPNGVFPEISL